MLNHLGFFFFFCFFFIFFSKVRVGAKEGGSHYLEMAVAITCGYGGYLLPLLAAHSSYTYLFRKFIWEKARSPPISNIGGLFFSRILKYEGQHGS